MVPSLNFILSLHGVSGKGISSLDKQALIDINNVADLNNSSIKTDIVNKLNVVSTETVLGLTAASSWATIQAAIPNTKTGKKTASGTVTSSIPGSSAITTMVSGIAFTPRTALIYSEANNIWAAFGTYKNGIWSSDSVLMPNFIKILQPTDGSLKVQNTNATGFGSGSFFWIAYE